MGLLDYYKQFQELSPEEVSAGFLAERDERRAHELAVIRRLDLTATTWWEPPHAEIVNQATFALRRSMNTYPDPAAVEARTLIAARHAVEVEQVVLGHGAGELIHGALEALLSRRGGEVVVPWPAWPVLPAMVERAGGVPVAVPLREDGTVDLPAVHGAVGPDTRAVIVCTPNDPTGLALSPAELRDLADSLPPGVWLLLDEALAEFRAPGEEATALASELENVLSFRSFSKAHALAGFRVGYAVGPVAAANLLAGLAPAQGVNSPAQAGLIWALEEGDALVTRRRAAALVARDRLAEALRGTSLSFPPAEAPFVWLASSEHSGTRLHSHLAARSIHVMPGRAWGDDHHVRVQLRDPAAIDRLAGALNEAL